MNDEPEIGNHTAYDCTLCGNNIVVPIDESAVAEQEFVDECPLCGHSNVIHIQLDGHGTVQVWVKGHSHMKGPSHEEQKDLDIHTQ